MRGGSCWFAVEMRSFKISIEKVLGKLKDVIMERGRGFTSGTKFGKTSLSCFLEGAKAYCM